jgi:anti-anti-sigma factor
MELKTLESTDKASVVALIGHLGLEATQKIEASFKRATSGTHKSSVVDMSGVTFISSYGVRMFLDVLQSLEKEGKKLLLVAPQPEVKEILVACEMDTLAGICDTKEAALAAV